MSRFEAIFSSFFVSVPLTTLLGVLTLASYGVDWMIQLTFSLTLTAIYLINFIDFLCHPDQAIIGYKG